MATFYGPSVRNVQVDGSDGTPYALGSETYQMLRSAKLVEKEQEVTSVTGPVDTSTVNRAEGFIKYSRFVIEIDYNRGSPLDHMTHWGPHLVGSTTTRTVTITFASGDTEAYECYFTKWAPKTDPKKTTVVMLEFQPDGTAPTYAP